MKVLLFVAIMCILLLANALPASEPHTFLAKSFSDAVSQQMEFNSLAKYFDQDIDHFGEKGGTFKQLYYESLCEEEDLNNLKFLLIGGEHALSTGSVAISYMSQLADEFLADKYALEHRFYGQSQPFHDITTESLTYLTIDQTIEDIRNFIEFINSNTPNSHNKWILFGGSYAGNLAVWSKVKYPELILGVVASSPQIQAHLNFKEYLEAVSEIINKKDKDCIGIIKRAMSSIVHLFSTKEGKETLKTQFKMCERPIDQFDKYSLASYIVGIFNDAVEFNTKVNTGDRVSLLCQNLKTRKGTEFEKLASLVVDHYKAGNVCFNYNYDSNSVLFQTELSQYSYERQWYYQKCNELGYFQTTGSNNQPFAHALPLLYYTKMCKDAFGSSFTEKTIAAAVERTNSKYYKAKDITDIRNLLVVHGSSDPWNRLGEISFTSDKSEVITITDGWHCQDMAMASDSDSEEIKKGRVQISNMIEHWISE